MNGPNVTAIVVNWRLKEMTAQCLRSLEQLDTPCQMVVIDNASGDDSVEYLSKLFGGAEILTPPANLGFAAACNLGIGRALRDASCEYVLLLNNDAVIDPHAVSELVQVARSRPRAGILGPKVYYSHQAKRIWYAGARRRRWVLAAAETRRGEIDRGQFNTVREVDYVFGAAMLIRREVIDRIGLFDEEFFLYLEDLDYCLRAQLAGFSLLFVPEAHVWHHGSASTADRNALRGYHLSRSTISFLRKHTSLASMPLVLTFWVMVFLRMFFADVARGDLAVVQSCWRGLLDGVARWNGATAGSRYTTK